MSIVTKAGDYGRTSLLGGARVDKDDVRIDLVGILDELNSFLGMSKSLVRDSWMKDCLESIQRDLFVLGAEIVTPRRLWKGLKKTISPGDVDRLERAIHTLEAAGVSRCLFCIPGKDFAASTIDVARTIARRAERRAVALKKKRWLKNGAVLVYLNRLSDILYLLARKEEK